jgi:Cys-tRNA(Pro) deacylase
LSNEKLDSYLQERGVNAKILTLKNHTMTVEAAENELGIGRGKIIKTLVFKDEKGEPLIGIVTGDKKVDVKKIVAIYGAKEIIFTPAKEVKKVTGYEVGALPPVGHKKIIRTFIDPKVMTLDKVYGGGGEVNTILEIAPEDIQRLTNARVEDISKD